MEDTEAGGKGDCSGSFQAGAAYCRGWMGGCGHHIGDYDRGFYPVIAAGYLLCKRHSGEYAHDAGHRADQYGVLRGDPESDSRKCVNVSIEEIDGDRFCEIYCSVLVMYGNP